MCLEQNVRNRIWTTDYKLVDISYFIPSAQRTVQISKKKKNKLKVFRNQLGIFLASFY